MTKAIVFDMDGTLNDFYNVEGWQENLLNENVRPYAIAPPKIDIDSLNFIIQMFQYLGWKIIITSWLAKNSSNDFKRETRQAKRKWLNQYNIPYDEIHLVAYGTLKSSCSKGKADYQILVDDNESVRDKWTLGSTIDANTDILAALNDILVKELSNR